MSGANEPRWIGGAEAVAHIVQTTGCDEAGALDRLKSALRHAAEEGFDVGRSFGVIFGEDYHWRIERGLITKADAWCNEFLAGNVRLDQCEFCRNWVLSEWPPSATAEAKPKARKSNGLDFRERDTPLLDRMHGMIQSGGATSPEDAARAVCADAAGNGQEASKVKRLAKHYRGAYPAEKSE